MKSEWFETFFQGPAVEFWARVLPPAMTLAESDFLAKTLAPEGPARLLDVPCGHGRHAIELARRGHNVTGVDLSDDFLAAAQRGSAEAAVDVDWRRGDMRSLDLPKAAFDGAYCWGNSFGYLDRANAEAFLRSVARAVRPGGKLAIDHGTAAESVFSVLPPKRWHRTGDIFVLSEVRYVPEASRMDIDYTFIQDGKVDTRRASSYVMTTGALRELLERCGFHDVVYNAGIAGEPYQMGSPRLVVTATIV